VAYPLLSRGGELAVYRVAALASVAAVLVGARAHGLDDRWPRWLTLLLVGLVVINVGLMVQLVSGGLAAVVSQLMDALGNVILLAASISLVISRYHVDLGGVADTAIIGLAAGGLLWNFALLPIAKHYHATISSQVRAFFVIFALSGVVGALVRLAQVGKGRLSAFWFLSAALALAIGANVLLAVPWLAAASAMMFMLAYTCVGLFGLDPTAYRIVAPGAEVRDTLTGARLWFLGTAVAIIPVTLGLGEVIGGRTNGVLLVLGSGLVTALVMLRIRRLSLERQLAEEALGHLASHDPLTNLLNRREFETRLGTELARTRRCALLFCDLDEFKQVNDQLGHSAGDELLIQVADRLVAAVRRSDDVARLGGDEFLILLREAGPSDVEGVLERISAGLSRPVTVDSTPVRVGLSIGVVVAFTESGGAEDLIQRADHAMYRAKQAQPMGAVRIASG
jgi:diguanylate cyclase (GGDEF)-like protein